MTDSIKSVTERLVDGFNDYFNDVESFDGRYVCGQLFLYGKAKAYDVGIPGSYNGGNQVKVNYMINWFNHKWQAAETELLRIVSNAFKYDSFEDSTIFSMGKLASAVQTEQYVSVLSKIVEAQQFIKLNQIQSSEYHKRINDLKITAVTAFHPIEMHIYLNELLDVIRKRLEVDYDGERLYPSATLTLLSCIDHLKNDFTAITHDNALNVIKIDDTINFTSEFVSEAITKIPFEKLIGDKVPEALVLGVKNYQLLEKSLKHTENVISLMEEILCTLLKE